MIMRKGASLTRTSSLLKTAENPAPNPRPRSRRQTDRSRHLRRNVPGQKIASVGRKAQFLKAYAEMGSIAGACQAIGLARCLIYEWRAKDPHFADAMVAAEETAVELLESAAYTRALAGSDRLLMFLLEKLRPHIYGDPHGRRGEVHIDQRQQVAMSTTFHVDALADHDLATLKANVQQLLEKAKAAAALNGKPTLALPGRS